MSYTQAIALGLAAAVAAAVVGHFSTTPYGRFSGPAWGPTVPVRLGWLIMEAPALPVFFLVLGGPSTPLASAGAIIWSIHYLNRWLIFPLAMKPRPDSRMALAVVASGLAVVSMHAWLYATWLRDLAPDPALGPRFWTGLVLWSTGFSLIVHTEHLLRSLRRPDDTRYRIPFGGGFRWVSSPHYLGEILAFTGMMVALACPGGLVVLALTLANLVPRAAATHRWYHHTFPEYPTDRRALVPLLW